MAESTQLEDGGGEACSDMMWQVEGTPQGSSKGGRQHVSKQGRHVWQKAACAWAGARVTEAHAQCEGMLQGLHDAVHAQPVA